MIEKINQLEQCLTLKELEIFYHLCQNPHLSNLSKEIGMSQSAISLALKSLENKLSEPLFDRIGKKLILNDRGKLFREKTYEHYLALLDSKDMFKESKLFGTLKIASSKSIGNFVMPDIIHRFLTENSDIKIDNTIENSATIIQSVLEGTIDMGVVESKCTNPFIIAETISKDRLVVVTSDKELAEKPRFIDSLLDKRWIIREDGSGTRELFLNELSDMAKKLNIFMVYHDFEEAKRLLGLDREILTAISKFAVQKELESGELYEVELTNITFEREFYLIYHKQKYKNRLFEAFLTHLRTFSTTTL